jgi:uncharacterized membrane protein YgaE (UPF0421/DUF939 family)
MGAVRERLRDPLVWGNAFLLVKAAGAAVLAWVLAKSVFGLAQPFLAPWAALLTVHATVYRTFARGAQQVFSALLGVLLAFAAGAVFGVNAAALGVVLLVALTAGTTRVLRDESTTAATTALVVLLAGYSSDPGMVGTRLIDTLCGIAVGLLVNLLVWPPLRDRSAARQVDVIDDRLGALLGDIARATREGREREQAERWAERTRELDQDISDAWAVLRRARESGRLNLRRTGAARVDAAHGLAPLLARLEQAVADSRSMAGTIARASSSGGWDPGFRATWLDLVERAGAAVSEADAQAITRAREDLESAAREWFRGGPDAAPRPVQGALIVNLRNILEAMDAVAEAQPVRVEARPATALRGRRNSIA